MCTLPLMKLNPSPQRLVEVFDLSSMEKNILEDKYQNEDKDKDQNEDKNKYQIEETNNEK